MSRETMRFAVLALIFACSVTPTATRTTAPSISGPTALMTLDRWNPERHSEDWPGPFRIEPADGEVSLVDSPDLVDPKGDVGFDAIDIVEVAFRLGCWNSLTTEPCVFFEVAAEPQLAPDPRVEWVAWGIVVDYSGDGQPDARFGVDNSPGTRSQPGTATQTIDPEGIYDLRMWRTDLATGTTEASTGSLENPSLMDVDRPGRLEDPGRLDDRGHIFVKRLANEPFFHFYVWASMIRDGQVVATDYAPDSGWIATTPPQQ